MSEGWGRSCGMTVGDSPAMLDSFAYIDNDECLSVSLTPRLDGAHTTMIHFLVGDISDIRRIIFKLSYRGSIIQEFTGAIDLSVAR